LLELTCTNEQKILVTVIPVTAAGIPAPLDGPVVVTVEAGDGTVVSVTDTSFYVVSGDVPGMITYLVSADANLGEGVETISDFISLTVEGAKAINLGLVAGVPELK